MKLRVTDGTQITVDGTTYGGGQELEVGDEQRQADGWVARGWATRLDAPAAADPEPTADDAGDKGDAEADQQPRKRVRSRPASRRG